MINKKGGFAQFRGWQSILITVGVLVLIYFVTIGVYKLLSWLAIPLLIATAIIKYQVILNFFKGIGNLFKRNPLLGIGAGLLTAFLHPIVIAFLFFQAMTHRKADKIQGDINAKKEGEYVEYEEISHEVDSENLLEDLNREKRQAEENLDYWDLLNDDEPPKRKDIW